MDCATRLARIDLTAYFRAAITVAALFVISGCAPVAIAPASPESTKISVNKALAQRFRITDVTSLSESNSSDIKNVVELMTDLLPATLANFDYLQPIKSKPAYSIKAIIKNLDRPFIGFDYDVKLTVAYAISDEAGKLIFERTIDSNGGAKVSEELFAYARLQLAYKRCIEESLKQFVTELSGASFPPRSS